MKKTTALFGIALVCMTSVSNSLIAADSTSYAPPGVTQNRDMDRHDRAITNASTVRANDDMRAPIYYDSNNTSYYMNPSSSSYTNRVYAASDMRAPRYYDRDNTGYYMDPASTSMFNAVRANIYYDRQNTGYYLHPADYNRLNRVVANRVDSSTSYISTMYDRDNTGYYVNPASTSNVNRMLVKYNGGMPTYAYDVATKKYVDSKLGSVTRTFYTIPGSYSGTKITGYHHFCAIAVGSNLEDSHHITITTYGTPNSESKVRWKLTAYKAYYRRVVCMDMF